MLYEVPSVGHHRHLVPLGFEQLGKGGENVHIVVDDQNRLRVGVGGDRW